jgi:iron complex transport system permease protein
VGAALAVAGVSFQALLRNPLADPYILGVSGGAAFGAMVAMVLGFETSVGGLSAVPLMAFLGAVGTIFLVYRLGATSQGAPRYTLLLAGVIVNAFFSAVIMFATSLVDIARSSEIVFWLMGSLDSERYATLGALAIYLAVGTVFLMTLARGFNVMALGDDAASQLGIDVGRLKWRTFVAASLVTAVAVAQCGPIGFVGLIVPHAVRLIVGPDHRILLPASFFAGAMFLAVADTFARTVIAPTQVPVGVVTAICGGPFFLMLLFGRRRNSEWG